jgi:hypothetical protein
MKAVNEWPVLSPDERTRLGLSRRKPKPETTVAARHPEVLDMWDEANAFGPGDLPSSSPVKAMWICASGHRFVESVVVQCGAVSGWRAEAGGSRACKHCHEDRQEDRVRLECGHSVLIRPGVEDRKLCWNCNEEWFQQHRALVRSTRDALLPSARSLAEQILDEQQVPQLFRSLAHGKLAHIIAHQIAVATTRGEEPPAVGDMPKAMDLLHQPTAAEIGRSVAQAQPIKMFDVQFWPEGFGLPTGIHDNYALGLPFARMIAGKIHELLPIPVDVPTANATLFLTQRIKTILYTNQFVDGLRATVARELRLPIAANPEDVRPGRLDVTAMYGVIPSIVIELDSTNKASSLGKLEYARDCGAYPIWVRWNARDGVQLGSPGVVTVTPAGLQGHFADESLTNSDTEDARYAGP